MLNISEEYKNLFALIARNGAINGEKAMDVVSKEKPDEDLTNTKKMTQDFRDLEDKIYNDVNSLAPMDFIHLWVGASLSRTVIQKNIDVWTAVVQAYDNDLIPKLYEVAKASSSENWGELVGNYFNIKDEEKSSEEKSSEEKN